MDKKKSGSEHVENDKQFLERSGASSSIKDVISKVLENRPEDPVDFLSNYFETLGDKVDKVSRAYQQVSLTHYSKLAFTNNVRIAYDLLGQTKGKAPFTLDRRGKAARKESGKQVRGITGATYMEFLHQMCRQMPPPIRDRLMKKIRCRDYEVVSFSVFRSAVFTVLVLMDYLLGAERLFHSLDIHNTGKVERVLCEAITHQLQVAVTTTSTNPAAMLEAGYALAPKKVHSVLSTAFFKASGDKKTMNQEDFVISAADAFLMKVRILR